ncbi:MAG: riboflavin biosynthesis protein RibF [Dehalococcoidia bacterium]|nr:riboflavin biosynthesis protein RibF [Chloroflexi bacterium CFX7]MCK6564395.1 riboflavin biosynthesis protein RibF [Dehalococcoidia bacterium]NUQ54317.1 riboflavin biosynthesis protein RibF [Dehalococcoidia bacterium]RIL03341.1 MAG: riboflavin biosynthesis protein RibF [bacterium]
MPIPSFTRTQLMAGAPGPATALTIGVLDGVHRGHQFLLRRLREEARKRALSPGVVTLHPHPVTVLRPELAPSYLTSLEDRMELMRAAGADWVVPLTFTSEVSEVSAEDLARAFFEHLRMRLMVLGPDAAFGRGAPRDTAARMRALGKELGFEVLQIEPMMHDHERYSSTAVRRALADGDMERVSALLGRHYRLGGPVVKGFERGQSIGFPTANISVAADRALPALGVYATQAAVREHHLQGATNIGRRPTFDAGHVSIETYLLDFEGDIYGERLELEVVHYVRPEQSFGSVAELSTQIARDIAAVREALS